jgi:hypothetical protein
LAPFAFGEAYFHKFKSKETLRRAHNALNTSDDDAGLTESFSTSAELCNAMQTFLIFALKFLFLLFFVFFQFLVVLGVLNSGSCACLAGTLPLKPLCQSFEISFDFFKT